MRNRLKVIFLVAVGLLTVSVPVSAHHGNAAYDTDKVVTVKATVTSWLWSNPHCWIKLDVKDDKGNVVHWIVEGANTVSMVRGGYTRTILKPGDEVTATFTPAKNGVSVGRSKQIVLADGTVLKG